VFDLSTKCIAPAGGLLVIGFGERTHPTIAENRILIKDMQSWCAMGPIRAGSSGLFAEGHQALTELYEKGTVNSEAHVIRWNKPECFARLGRSESLRKSGASMDKHRALHQNKNIWKLSSHWPRDPRFSRQSYSEADVVLADELSGRARRPFWSLYRRTRSVELRDGDDKRYLGKARARRRAISLRDRTGHHGHGAGEQSAVDHKMAGIGWHAEQKQAPARTRSWRFRWLKQCRRTIADDAAHRYLGGVGANCCPSAYEYPERRRACRQLRWTRRNS